MSDEKSKAQTDIESMAPDQLETLKSLVDAETEKRGKWHRVHEMPGGEFDAFFSEVCEAGDRERREKEAAIRRARASE